MRAKTRKNFKSWFKRFTLLTIALVTGLSLGYGVYLTYKHYNPPKQQTEWKIPLFMIIPDGGFVTKEFIITDAKEFIFCMGIEYDNKILCYEKVDEGTRTLDDGSLQPVEVFKGHVIPTR